MWMKRIGMVASLLVALVMTGCATDRAVIGQAQQFHGGIEKAVIEDPQLSNYIQRVGDRIIAGARQYYQEHPEEKASGESRDWMFSKDVRFHFVNSKTLNAFTTGGEHMYIYSELFRTAQTEDELAAVMAHEFAHIYGRHVQKGMNRQYAILGAAAAAGAGGYAFGGSSKGGEYAAMGAGLAQLAGQFVGMHYTRGDEAQADTLGFEFYTRAGYDPERFGDFFKRMIELGYDKGPEYLSDHPSLKSRAEWAEQRAEKLTAEERSWRKQPVASAAEFKRLQERALEVGKNMPNDESLQETQKVLAAVSRSCLTPSITPDQKEAEREVMQDLQEARQKGQVDGATNGASGTNKSQPDGKGNQRQRKRQADAAPAPSSVIGRS